MTDGLLLDDRLLIAELLASEPTAEPLMTTSLWYFRACRAAVIGAGGQLSGPFRRLGEAHQRAAIRRLLTLSDEIELADARRVVPEMARVAERHPRLNVMNLEAVAAAVTHRRTVALSPPTAAGILPGVLREEGVDWVVVEPK